MRTRVGIALLVFMMVQAVVFGIGAVVILSTSLAASAAWLLPAVIVASVLISAPLSWLLAPRLRARYWRAKGKTPRGADRVLAGLA